MDLLRRQVQRRIFADLVLVEGLAVGQRIGIDRLARLGHIFATHEGQQLLIAGRDGVADQCLGLRLHRLALVGWNGVRHRGERLVEGIVGAGGQERLDRLITSLDRHARHGIAALQARLHVGDLLVEIARDILHPAEIAAIIVGAGKGRARVEAGPEEGIAVERRLIGLVLDLGRILPDRRLEHRLVDIFLMRQLGVGNLVELFEDVAPIGIAVLLGGGGHAGQMIVGAAFGPAAAGQAGEFFLAPAPFGVIQRLEFQVGGGRLCGRCIGGRRRLGEDNRGRAGEPGDGEQGCGVGHFHECLSSLFGEAIRRPAPINNVYDIPWLRRVKCVFRPRA